MRPHPRFFLITNDGPRAALTINCHMGNLPRQIAVVDDPALWMLIPDGAQCRCFWFGERATIAAWESAWRPRVERGGLQWISEEDWARIQAWAQGPARVGPHTEFDDAGRILGLDGAPIIPTREAETQNPASTPLREETPEQAESGPGELQAPVRRQAGWS